MKKNKSSGMIVKYDNVEKWRRQVFLVVIVCVDWWYFIMTSEHTHVGSSVANLK